jgi:hypothetical protein
MDTNIYTYSDVSISFSEGYKFSVIYPGMRKHFIWLKFLLIFPLFSTINIIIYNLHLFL